MSWKDIMKAPTSNRQTPRHRQYKGNRPYSYIDDDMMEQIVKDLKLPETNEDGEKIEYEEGVDDFMLVPSLKSLGSGQYELEIKFEGEIGIWPDEANKAAHIFKADDIEFESTTIEAQLGKPFSLDYEFSQYYNGKIFLEVFIE